MNKIREYFKLEETGLTLIELLAVIVILAVIALITTPIILGIVNNSKKEAFKDTAYGIAEAAKNQYIKEMYSGATPSNITFTYTDNIETSSVINKSLSYSGQKPKSGIVELTSKGEVAIAIHDGTYCAYKSYSDVEIAIEAKPVGECKTSYSVAKSVNVPVLAAGMTPIKWNGTTWIETTVGDKNWYDYTNKTWANAKTADGSMWVWIPRYIYNIPSANWHKSAAGTISIQFSKGTNDNWNSAVIGNIDTGSTSNASNNKWTNHPAFTFGTELTGIWVAKFEASGTSSNVEIKPDAASLTNLSPSGFFDVARNMETNSKYGWNLASGLKTDGTFTTDGNGVDTHMMKNIEWGAVAYLAQSNYGKNSEIWVNAAYPYITGCSGDSISSNYPTTCNQYNTANGQQASSTGNVYGIYDMAAGTIEYLAAYVNNGNIKLNTATSIVNAIAKYKDVYDKASTDNATNNYALAANKKGDAIYETSNGYNESFDSWYGNRSSMPNTNWPLFIRNYSPTTARTAGTFSFAPSEGVTNQYQTFHPVLIVGSGL